MTKRYGWLLIAAVAVLSTLSGATFKDKTPAAKALPPVASPAAPSATWEPDGDAFHPVKGVALLDLTTRNGEQEDGSENSRHLYSAEHMLEVAGMPFFTTKNLLKAMDESSLILCSSPIKTATFSSGELAQLTAWVQGGGVLVAPACIDITPAITHLFGITASSYLKTRHLITWEDSVMHDKELEYMDEPEEKDISIGSTREAIKSYGYTLSTATGMAHFNTGEVAVARHRVGDGCVYSFGVLWRDVIQRPQLNKDFSAQRSYSNDFEPSADVFPLFVRSAYAKCHRVAAWKSTIPGGYLTVLIPTHDCDSKTAYDAMHYMSSYEKALGMKGHYFMTTRYYRDPQYSSAYYDSIGVVNTRKLLADGHTVGSHSIGHFPDFSNTSRFPNTVVTRETYMADHDPATGITTGGSTWAETVLSKMILENDLGNTVRSFRSGHLLVNKNLPLAMEEGGYSFSSCYGAGDVLTAFPYLERIGNDWAGRQTKVLQMPLHFSDVLNDDPINDSNWHEKPALWLGIMHKLAGNYAPSMLLIHPNREWKMLVEKALVDTMDREKYGLFNFEDYGDFWLARRALHYEFSFIEATGKVIIRATRHDFDNNPHLSFMIEADQMPSAVVLMDENAFSLPLQIKQVATGRFLAYR